MLSFEISLPKTQFAVGEPIPLTMVLRNVSSEPLTVNKRLLVNDASARSAFRDVTLHIRTPSGDEAAFGFLINVGFPRPEDFTKLAPGEAFEKSLDISRWYRLDAAGEYDLKAVYQNALAGPPVLDQDTDTYMDSDIGAVKARATSNALAFQLRESTN